VGWQRDGAFWRAGRAVSQQQARLVGWGLIAVVGALYIAALVHGAGVGGPKQGAAPIITGLLLQFVGLLFVLAYFYPASNFVFRGLMWMCEHFSNPKGRGMAFFYFALSFGLGTAAILQGLGIIEGRR
jgi:hypothetical protein